MDVMTLAGIAVVVIIIVLLMVMAGKAQPNDMAPLIQIHPAQMKFMEEKEAKYCSGNTKGKGIRCIIDFAREEAKEKVTKILAEKKQFSEGFVTMSMDLYGQQIDWLSELGIKPDPAGEGAGKYNDFSATFRAMLDYAMRMDKEDNKDEIESMFGNVRCLNC
jgi:hypothetical protein